MKTIEVKEFMKILEDISKKYEVTDIRICEYDTKDTFSITINKGENVQFLEISNESWNDCLFKIRKKNRYDILFEEIKKNFKERYIMHWINKGGCKGYSLGIIIDRKVVIRLQYLLPEGQRWLNNCYYGK